jgi:hypothetical protein
VHVAEVLARGSGYEVTTEQAMQQASDRFEKFGQVTIPGHPRCVKLMCASTQSAIYFEKTVHVTGLPWPALWRELPGDPTKSALPFEEKVARTCDRSDCSEVVAACGHEQIEEAMGVVGDVPWDQPAPPPPCEHDWVETPWATECSKCGHELTQPVGSFEGLPVGEQKVIAPAAPKPTPKRSAPLTRSRSRKKKPATVACEAEGCEKKLPPGEMIVDGNQVRRCGECYQATLATAEVGTEESGPPKGADAAELPWADPAPGDGSSGSSSGSEEAPEGMKPCPACTHPEPRLPCSVSGPCGGSRWVEVGGLPAEVKCGACDHVGKHHDFRTKKCAECDACPGFELPELGGPVIAKRWEVSCPACPSNRVTPMDPTGAPCRDCGYSTPIHKVCGEPITQAFDWARFLVRGGQPVSSSQPRRCRICEAAIEFGASCWQAPNNKTSIAHDHCVADELGYAAVMIREGKVVEAELNAAAAEKGEAKQEPCMVCSTGIEPGVMCYGHGDKGQRVFAHYECVEGKGVEPPVSEGDIRDLCQWNPKEERAPEPGDPFHALATLVVGGSAKTRIRLCAGCRKLKPHRRLRKEVAIKPAGKLAALPF